MEADAEANKEDERPDQETVMYTSAKSAEAIVEVRIEEKGVTDEEEEDDDDDEDYDEYQYDDDDDYLPEESNNREEVWIDESISDFMDLDEDVARVLDHVVGPYEESFAIVSEWASAPSASLVQRMLDLIVVELIFQTGLDLVWRFFHRREFNRSESFTTPRSRGTTIAIAEGDPYNPHLSATSPFRLTRTDSFVHPFGEDERPDVYAAWIKSLEDSAERVIGLSGLDPNQPTDSTSFIKPSRTSQRHPSKRLARLLLHPDADTSYRTMMLINCLLRYDSSLELLLVFLNSLTHKFVWVSIGKVIEEVEKERHKVTRLHELAELQRLSYESRLFLLYFLLMCLPRVPVPPVKTTGEPEISREECYGHDEPLMDDKDDNSGAATSPTEMPVRSRANSISGRRVSRAPSRRSSRADQTSSARPENLMVNGLLNDHLAVDDDDDDSDYSDDRSEGPGTRIIRWGASGIARRYSIAQDDALTEEDFDSDSEEYVGMHEDEDQNHAERAEKELQQEAEIITPRKKRIDLSRLRADSFIESDDEEDVRQITFNSGIIAARKERGGMMASRVSSTEMRLPDFSYLSNSNLEKGRKKGKVPMLRGPLDEQKRANPLMNMIKSQIRKGVEEEKIEELKRTMEERMNSVRAERQDEDLSSWVDRAKRVSVGTGRRLKERAVSKADEVMKMSKELKVVRRRSLGNSSQLATRTSLQTQSSPVLPTYDSIQQMVSPISSPSPSSSPSGSPRAEVSSAFSQSLSGSIPPTAEASNDERRSQRQKRRVGSHHGRLIETFREKSHRLRDRSGSNNSAAVPEDADRAHRMSPATRRKLEREFGPLDSSRSLQDYALGSEGESSPDVNKFRSRSFRLQKFFGEDYVDFAALDAEPEKIGSQYSSQPAHVKAHKLFKIFGERVVKITPEEEQQRMKAFATARAKRVNISPSLVAIEQEMQRRAHSNSFSAESMPSGSPGTCTTPTISMSLTESSSFSATSSPSTTSFLSISPPSNEQESEIGLEHSSTSVQSDSSPSTNDKATQNDTTTPVDNALRKRNFRLTRFFGEKVVGDEVSLRESSERSLSFGLGLSAATPEHTKTKRLKELADNMRRTKSVANIRAHPVYTTSDPDLRRKDRSVLQ